MTLVNRQYYQTVRGALLGLRIPFLLEEKDGKYSISDMPLMPS